MVQLCPALQKLLGNFPRMQLETVAAVLGSTDWLQIYNSCPGSQLDNAEHLRMIHCFAVVLSLHHWLQGRRYSRSTWPGGTSSDRIWWRIERFRMKASASQMMPSKWCHHSSKWWHQNDGIKMMHQNDGIKMMASKWWHHRIKMMASKWCHHLRGAPCSIFTKMHLLKTSKKHWLNKVLRVPISAFKKPYKTCRKWRLLGPVFEKGPENDQKALRL